MLERHVPCLSILRFPVLTHQSSYSNRPRFAMFFRKSETAVGILNILEKCGWNHNFRTAGDTRSKLQKAQTPELVDQMGPCVGFTVLLKVSVVLECFNVISKRNPRTAAAQKSHTFLKRFTTY